MTINYLKFSILFKVEINFYKSLIVSNNILVNLKKYIIFLQYNNIK
jgi:hypothetical protein